jgi:hypothetical protein
MNFAGENLWRRSLLTTHAGRGTAADERSPILELSKHATGVTKDGLHIKDGSEGIRHRILDGLHIKNGSYGRINGVGDQLRFF